MKPKCIIFGASKTGKSAYRLLQKEYEIIGFSDNDSSKWGKEFCGVNIYPPEDLLKTDAAEIIIASVWYSNIYQQLHAIGIENTKVFFLIGDAFSETGSQYKLYKINGKCLFENSVYNPEEIRKIQHDFGNNYDNLDSTRYSFIDINESKKNVLFCAYLFPPAGGAGVQRSLKFVKYLRKYGYEPIVLTVGNSDKKMIEDLSFNKEISDDIKVIRIDNEIFLPEFLSDKEQQEIYNLYAGVVCSREWMDKYIDIIHNKDARLIPDNRIIWVNECLKYIGQIIDINKIDIVYTTGVPFSSYILGYYLKKKYGIKWVQDYRDPWAFNNYYLKEFYFNDMKYTKDLQEKLERELVQYSDAVIHVSEGWIEEFSRLYQIPLEKNYCITNGYDELDFCNIKIKEKQEKFCLCYNGGFRDERVSVMLIKVITKLISTGKIKQDKIKWIFNGYIDDRIKQKFNQEDYFHIIQYNGYLNHINSIEIAMNSDVLVLFGYKDSGAGIIYTGKLFEYLRMHRPVIAFSGSGGVIEKVLNKTGSGRNFEYDCNEEDIEDYIFNLYKLWENNAGRELKLNEEEIVKYNREYETGVLASVFDSLTSSSK